MEFKRKPIFNPEADDANATLYNGETTNLLYLKEAHYKWATPLYRLMRENFWGMDKVDISSEDIQYTKLSDAERRAYNGILSYLIFLDSLQTNNLGNVTQFTTSPEVVRCLAEATSQEGLHSTAYQDILEAAVTPEQADEIYFYWKSDKVLFERTQYVSQEYQNFIDNPTQDNFMRMLFADLMLEGLYFWAGFYFFFSLASRGLMTGTADAIRLIMRDEKTHIALFRYIISELLSEMPKEDAERYKEIFTEMAHDAVEKEIAWWTHIIGNDVLGFNTQVIEDFIKYTAAKNIFHPFGLEPDFEVVDNNPLKRLDMVAAVDDSSNMKGNFFETSSNLYQHAEADDDEW